MFTGYFAKVRWWVYERPISENRSFSILDGAHARRSTNIKFTRQRIYNKPAMAYEYSMVSNDLINNWDMFVNINSSY